MSSLDKLRGRCRLESFEDLANALEVIMSNIQPTRFTLGLEQKFDLIQWELAEVIVEYY